jgi:hypothetical protein
MQKWLETHLANGFSDFAGTEISASIRMSESLLNELLSEGLKAAAGGTGKPDGEVPGIASLVKLITRADVHPSDGALTVRLEIRV